MSNAPFVSYAQNAEDVVLWRALRHVQQGRYVEVGANDPTHLSITRAFYDRGWRGLEIEPVPEFAERFRAERPDDEVVEAAITAEDVDEVSLHIIDGTGLSTLVPDISTQHASQGWQPHDVTVTARRLDDVLAATTWAAQEPIHFMVIDTEGSELGVLQSIDLQRFRPWILVIEATAPLTNEPTYQSWEGLVLDAGYEFCLFDGLSRFYVSSEQREALADALSHTASPLDDWLPAEVITLRARVAELESTLAGKDATYAELERERNTLLDTLVYWRGAVLSRWAEAATGISGTTGDGSSSHEVARLKAELEAIQATLSWRVTAPLRVVRERQLHGGRH